MSQRKEEELNVARRRSWRWGEIERLSERVVTSGGEQRRRRGRSLEFAAYRLDWKSIPKGLWVRRTKFEYL